MPTPLRQRRSGRLSREPVQAWPAADADRPRGLMHQTSVPRLSARVKPEEAENGRLKAPAPRAHAGRVGGCPINCLGRTAALACVRRAECWKLSNTRWCVWREAAPLIRHLRLRLGTNRLPGRGYTARFAKVQPRVTKPAPATPCI